MYKLIVLLATLSIWSGCPTADFGGIDTDGGEKRKVLGSEQEEANILSKNYDTALKALNFAVASRDTKTIRLGLVNTIFSIKIASAKALGDLCDKECVPALTKGLEDNQGTIDGGTEMRIFQAKLNSEIILALRKLTNLDLPAPDKPSRKEIAEIIKRVRKWEKQ